MFKKILILSFFVVLLVPNVVFADTEVVVSFFFSPTCPHCADEAIFLDNLEDGYSGLTIKRFDLSDRNNIEIVTGFYNKYQVPENEWGSTPATFIEKNGDIGKYFIGYAKSMDKPVEDYLEDLLEEGYEQVDDKMFDQSTSTIMSLPFIGNLDMGGFSPFILSIIVGGLDGFNACAMVALGFLLAILISTGVRKRVFMIGATFILVSGVVYFLFISAWLNLFLFLGYLKIITVIVSLVIIVFSIFLLKDYFTGVVCKLCNVKLGKEGFITNIQRWLFAKMNCLVSAKDMPLCLTLIGVALVAAGVNLVELFCSFGFPLAYTKILTSYDLPNWQYYGYLLIYIVMYMIDDFLIFIIAVITLRVTRFGDKYLKAIKLISGIVLLLLGMLMLFKPELLSIG